MFKATDDVIRTRFKSLETNEDLAVLLEIPVKSLLFFAYSKRKFYAEKLVPKKNNEYRTIYVPCNQLKTLQRKIVYILSLVYQPKNNVYGFVEHRSAIDNAKVHVGKRELLSIDLKDFFYQFHFGRVRGMFMKAPYNVGEEAATTLSNLLCVKREMPDGSLSTILPQGAPTSPIVSNMICSPFDNALIRFARNNKLFYTRYADDIVFSSNDASLSNRFVSYSDRGELILSQELTALFIKHKMVINQNKTKFRKYYQRQMVTGIIVNERTNIKREYVREIRSILFNCGARNVYDEAKRYAQKRGISLSDNRAAVESWFKKVIVGKITYIGSVTNRRNGAYYVLASKANEVFGESVFDLTDIYKEVDIAENNVIIIDNKNRTQQGTGFVVPGYGVFTCSHVLEENYPDYYASFSCFDRKGYSKDISLKTDIVFDKGKYPYDHDLDFALFYGFDKLFPNSKRILLGDSDKLNIGDEVVLIGYPEFDKGTYTRIQAEIISKGEHFSHPLYEVSAIIRHGLSGGIVLDSDNYVVGIVSAGISSTEFKKEDDAACKKFGFIPINCIREYMKNYYNIE